MGHYAQILAFLGNFQFANFVVVFECNLQRKSSSSLKMEETEKEEQSRAGYRSHYSSRVKTNYSHSVNQINFDGAAG